MIIKRVETVYTEEEWMRHVECHAKAILKRYAKRKARAFVSKLIELIPLFAGVTVFFCAYTIISILAMFV